MALPAASPVTENSHPLRIRAALFDFDGTLWDPEPHIFEAYAEVFRGHGQELTEALWSRVIGSLDFDLWADLQALTDRPVDRAKADAQVACTIERRLNDVGSRPGVAEYLRAADAAGLTRAIVSNSPTAWVHRYAQQCGLSRGWAGIYSAEKDRSCAKPAPALYTKAVTNLGLRPEEAVAFEDSPGGVLAAKEAGIWCVAVSNTVTAAYDLSAADVVLTSFLDTDFSALITSLGLTTPVEPAVRPLFHDEGGK